MVLLEDLSHREEIPKALGHLLRVDGHKPVMHPVSDGRAAAGGGAALCNFILVVGKNQVPSAAVDVQHWARQRLPHCAALNVPPRSPRAPRTVPRGLVRL